MSGNGAIMMIILIVAVAALAWYDIHRYRIRGGGRRGHR
jgi:hypothetical protein